MLMGQHRIMKKALSLREITRGEMSKDNVHMKVVRYNFCKASTKGNACASLQLLIPKWKCHT
jgi:hypothetical protein